MSVEEPLGNFDTLAQIPKPRAQTSQLVRLLAAALIEAMSERGCYIHTSGSVLCMDWTAGRSLTWEMIRSR